MQILEASIDEIFPILQAGAPVKLAVTGTSMQPLLRSGRDSVLLRPAVAPKKGDILLYRRENGRYVLHRMVGQTGDQLLCCGDNQWKKEAVAPHQVVAVVSCRYRKEKKLPVSGWKYRFYVNHLPLCRQYCRLRDWLCKR